jgi:hypothetical protein
MINIISGLSLTFRVWILRISFIVCFVHLLEFCTIISLLTFFGELIDVFDLPILNTLTLSSHVKVVIIRMARVPLLAKLLSNYPILIQV